MAKPVNSGDERREGKDSRAPYSEVAFAELRRRIFNNELPAGFQATEQEVADLLDMSRTPVREALIRLAGEGLVEVRPRHGMRVLPASADDMKEIYEILTSLESTAAYLVAARGPSDEELQELHSAVDSMEKALDDDDLIAWSEADRQFHSILVALCGNERLTSLVETFMGQAHRVRMLTLKLREKPLRSNADHAELVAAIERGDPEEARRIHRAHRERAGETLVGILESLGLVQL